MFNVDKFGVFTFNNKFISLKGILTFITYFLTASTKSFISRNVFLSTDRRKRKKTEGTIFLFMPSVHIFRERIGTFCTDTSDEVQHTAMKPILKLVSKHAIM